MNFDSKIDNERENIIKNTIELIKIPNENNSLKHILNVANQMGFKTKAVEGYYGIIEFGQGEELIGIVSHLDVVPEGEGWNHPPYGGIIENNKIYGRGAQDDKGPTIAALYAMKTIKDNIEINKRVRLILGLSEETTWKCIEKYKANEELPTIGFSPDGDFPCIYAEKGMLCFKICQRDGANDIQSIECDNPLNVVPNYCKVVVEKSELITRGKESHAAHPENGINAVAEMVEKLYNLDESNEMIAFLHNYIGKEYNGEKLGLNITDESGTLTLNLSKIALEDKKITAYFDIRYPISLKSEDIIDKFKNKGMQIEVIKNKPPLYVPKDSKLINTLTNVYNEYTNSNAEPIAIGGTTYAKAFKNVVAYGPGFPKDVSTIHQANENIEIDKLILMTKIYTKAIYELANI